MVSTEVISDKDLGIIESKKGRIINTVDSIIADIQYLADALAQYKVHLSSNIDSSIEEADIIRKYNGTSAPNTYNLPGIFSNVVGSYDLESSKRDQQRLEQVKVDKIESQKVKDASFTSIVQTYNKIKHNLNLLAQDNQMVAQYLDDLKIPL